MTQLISNKRIGIITFHRTTNFGSLLQTFALYYSIRKFGFECQIIDYRCPALEKRERIGSFPFSLNPRHLLSSLIVLPRYKKKYSNFCHFIKNNMVLTKEYYPDTIKNATSKFDKLITGSDIVWDRNITDNDYSFFLNFANDSIPKYAFASSVGDYDFHGDEEIVCKLLRRFNRIAVREKDAIKWLDHLGINNVSWVCDPTMLLRKEEWNLSIPPKKIKKKYVLIYFLDQKRKALYDAIKYAKAFNVSVYYINYGLPISHVHSIAPTSIEEFLGLLKNAQMVFTASYHGLLFSLYYNKEVLFYSRVHNSRMYSLAERLNITDHCGDTIEISQYTPIQYDLVNKKINEFRETSSQILLSMLKE